MFSTKPIFVVVVYLGPQKQPLSSNVLHAGSRSSHFHHLVSIIGLLSAEGTWKELQKAKCLGAPVETTRRQIKEKVDRLRGRELEHDGKD